MTTSYAGGCACGAIRYVATGAPVFANHCQCRDCQKRSGTGHGSYLTFPSRADGTITEPLAHTALDMQQVDADGLDKNDRKYLETLIDVFGGGPTGVEALAATMNIASDTLSDEIEPYLLREQFIVRSPRGRMAQPKAFGLLGREQPRPKSEEKAGPTLFE